MILQALKEYYDRKAADPDSDIAPEGFEKKEIPFLIVIDDEGGFINLEDTRESNKAKVFLLPKSKGRVGPKAYETTFLLWDHIGYLLGYPEDDEKSTLQHKTWLEKLDSLPDYLKNAGGVKAIINFYKNNGVEAVKSSPIWEDCKKIKSCNMTFRLRGEKEPIPCSKIVRDFVKESLIHSTDDIDSDKLGRCLITGEIGEIRATHTGFHQQRCKIFRWLPKKFRI